MNKVEKMEQGLDAALSFIGNLEIEPYSHLDEAASELRQRIMDANSEPPRNCDVGTAMEQRVRFEAWCDKQPERYCKACAECQTQRYAINCFCKWAQMPYTEGGAK